MSSTGQEDITQAVQQQQQHRSTPSKQDNTSTPSGPHEEKALPVSACGSQADPAGPAGEAPADPPTTTIAKHACCWAGLSKPLLLPQARMPTLPPPGLVGQLPRA